MSAPSGRAVGQTKSPGCAARARSERGAPCPSLSGRNGRSIWELGVPGPRRPHQAPRKGRARPDHSSRSDIAPHIAPGRQSPDFGQTPRIPIPQGDRVTGASAFTGSVRGHGFDSQAGPRPGLLGVRGSRKQAIDDVSVSLMFLPLSPSPSSPSKKKERKPIKTYKKEV